MQRDITNLAISDAVEENIWAAVKNKNTKRYLVPLNLASEVL